MFNVGILGSCVSRDAFEYDCGRFNVKGNYLPRHSLATLMNEKVSVNQKDVTGENEWLRRVIIDEFEKNVLERIKNNDLDMLIIDLIDERFDLIKFSEGVVNGSDDLLKSCTEFIEKENVRIIERESKEADALFFDSAGKFCDFMNSSMKEMKVIIHQSYCVDQYLDGGNLLDFNSDLIKKNQKVNSNLEKYYEFLISNLENVSSIRVSESLNVADKKHRWGLAPFHYIDEYYMDFLKQLNLLCE